MLMDVLLAAVLTGLTLDTFIRQSGGRIDWAACGLVVLTSAPVALRQRAPVVTMAVIVGALAGFGLLGYGSGDFPNGGLGMLLGMFTVATLRPRRVAALVFLTSLAVTTTYLAITLSAVWSQVIQATLVLVGAWVLGEGTRRWAERTEQLAARAAQAVADERVRIARELHDIVAHHMSVVSLQSGVAQYVLDSDLPTARSAISAAGDASREALTEMRRLLDVLRVDDVADSDYAPQPGIAALDELVARTRAAGVPVEVVVTGHARPLAPGPDLCAYRVVQESLTNVLKHAGPAAARVELDYGERTLTLTVRDDGAGARAPGASPASHGIRGMRERAELYGGVLTAGPLPEGGFAVVLRLPISEPISEPVSAPGSAPGSEVRG
jgi:signal transduction histidine kinase